MEVFISWSGSSGKAVADALASWLPRVINAVQPFVSSEIYKGARWPEVIAQKLSHSRFGIVCITPENPHAPWLMFEAGALSKTIVRTYLCTFLYGLEKDAVEWPLAQFQATAANNKDDVRQLVVTMNQAIIDEGGNGLRERHLDEAFEVFWPKLDDELRQIRTPNMVRDALDGMPDDFIKARARLFYQADELLGKLSDPIDDPEASNGRARYACIQGLRDHILYGPYEAIKEAGQYVAFFKIRIGSESPGGHLLYLDVSGGGQGGRQIDRAAFQKAGAYNTLALRFRVYSADPLEYRVLPMTRYGEFWIDYVAVVDETNIDP